MSVMNKSINRAHAHNGKHKEVASQPHLQVHPISVFFPAQIYDLFYALYFKYQKKHTQSPLQANCQSTPSPPKPLLPLTLENRWGIFFVLILPLTNA
jgi:hypothetical protein